MEQGSAEAQWSRRSPWVYPKEATQQHAEQQLAWHRLSVFLAGFEAAVEEHQRAEKPTFVTVEVVVGLDILDEAGLDAVDIGVVDAAGEGLAVDVAAAAGEVVVAALERVEKAGAANVRPWPQNSSPLVFHPPRLLPLEPERVLLEQEPVELAPKRVSHFSPWLQNSFLWAFLLAWARWLVEGQVLGQLPVAALQLEPAEAHRLVGLQ